MSHSPLNVQYAYSEMSSGNHSRLTSMTYPNGSAISYVYTSGIDNDISRLSSIASGTTTLEQYAYLGLDTVVKRTHPRFGNDIGLTYVKQSGEGNSDAGDPYTGFDRFGRVVDRRWIKSNDVSNPMDRFQYGYDRNSNRMYKDNLISNDFDELYHADDSTAGYDKFNQLSEFQRGALSDTNSDNVPDTSSDSHSQSWDLDSMGNWESLSTDGGTAVEREHNKQNQVTEVGSDDLAFDDNGNTTTDENGNTLVYDAWNRLVSSDDGTDSVEYIYDALGRRIQQTHDTGTPVTTDFYYSDKWQVLEERASGNAHAQYVWSPVYVDALIIRDRDADSSSGNGLEERVFVLQDANFNVTAITNAAGTVLERYVYDPYGTPTRLTASWGTPSSDPYGWVYLHQGGRYEAATGLYNFRNRDYSPLLGRWMQLDPLRYAAGDNNLYRSLGDNPSTFVDPLGLDYHHWFPKKYARDIKSLCNFFDIDFFTTGDVGSINDKNSYHYWIENIWDYGGRFEREVLAKSSNCCELLLNTMKLIAKTGAQLRLEKCGATGPYFPPLFHYETKTPTDQLLDDLVKLVCTQGPPKSMPPIPVPVPVPGRVPGSVRVPRPDFEIPPEGVAAINGGLIIGILIVGSRIVRLFPPLLPLQLSPV